MPPHTRPDALRYAACALVVAVLGAVVLARHRDAPGTSHTIVDEPPPAQTADAGPPARRGAPAGSSRPAVVVHVVGAVHRPGVYRMAEGARLLDAVRRAGGPTRRADLGAVNLAAKVSDGQQLAVPRRGARRAAASATPSSPGAAAVAGGPAAGAPIDLNTASAAELETLDGVGPATARKILQYREQHGGFKTVDELARVPGIGPKKLAAIKPRARV